MHIARCLWSFLSTLYFVSCNMPILDLAGADLVPSKLVFIYLNCANAGTCNVGHCRQDEFH